MKKGLTELVFILDRSGSMGGLESDTIGGFNGMIEKQKKQEGQVRVTTVLFDDRYKELYDRFFLEEIRPMTENEYYVRGCTALLDALGKSLEKMIRIQQNLPEECRAEKVIFVITTDGLENASREYSYSAIRQMIEEQKSRFGWEFLFMGANMDAVAEAGRFGIRPERAVTFKNDTEGVSLNYQVMGETICAMRSAVSMASVDGSWKEKIEKDYKKRGMRRRR